MPEPPVLESSRGVIPPRQNIVLCIVMNRIHRELLGI
jgi:hypothetical protein